MYIRQNFIAVESLPGPGLSLNDTTKPKNAFNFILAQNMCVGCLHGYNIPENLTIAGQCDSYTNRQGEPSLAARFIVSSALCQQPTQYAPRSDIVLHR